MARGIRRCSALLRSVDRVIHIRHPWGRASSRFPVSQFSLRVVAAEGEATDREAFEELAADLKSTLVAASQVTHVEQVSVGTAPEGTRGAEILGVCTFIITAVQTGEALLKVVQAIRWCVARYAERHRPVRINVAGMDVELTSETDVGAIVAALWPSRADPLAGCAAR